MHDGRRFDGSACGRLAGDTELMSAACQTLEISSDRRRCRRKRQRLEADYMGLSYRAIVPKPRRIGLRLGLEPGITAGLTNAKVDRSLSDYGHAR